MRGCRITRSTYNGGSHALLERSKSAPPAGGPPTRDDPAVGQPTSQERQIALHAAEGLINWEIGARIFLSLKTIERHLGNVYRKLQLHSRPDLIRYFSRLPD